MNTTGPPATEGYIYTVYGTESYLQQAVASAVTLRRHDDTRPIALVCDVATRQRLNGHLAQRLFDRIYPLDDSHNSILGFKHNVDSYMLFDSNLFLDCDMVWCKNPEPLWRALSAFDFTITGSQVADIFFGARKGLGIWRDILFNRRRRTLKRFGLTYFSRVQSGMIYARDQPLTEQVCTLARTMLSRQPETHFVSRKFEAGRSLESCEWSLALAMCKLQIPVFCWLQAQMSPQIDFISELTVYAPDFTEVNYRYYTDDFTNSLRGLQPVWLRSLLRKVISTVPGKGDYMDFTPFCLHFGWLHEKQPFLDFSESVWQDFAHQNDNSKLRRRDQFEQPQ